MFKKGDWVRLTYHHDDTCWPEGHEFEVDDIQDRGELGQYLGGLSKNKIYGRVPARSCILIEKENKMQKPVPTFHVLDETIVVTYDGKPHIIAKSDSRAANILECIRENRLEDLPAAVDVEKAFEGTGIHIKHGMFYEGENPMPQELSDRILKFKEENLPFEGLLAFWENLKKNPSFNARKMLFQFLEHNGHPLTQDGCFIAYRGVREDFKDKHTGTFDNSPGQVLTMPRELVDDNPNHTCSNGLHVACFDYAHDFARNGKLVEVKVNPVDVVCVPIDYDGTKMRTCKFEVIQECAEMRTETLDGHKPKTQDSTAEMDELLDEEGKVPEEERCPYCELHADDCEDHCQNCGEDKNPFANFCSECGQEI